MPDMEIGHLARVHGLAEPDDWTQGVFWSWVGRSKSRHTIAKDITSFETTTNFAGHLMLETPDGRLVCFGTFDAEGYDKIDKVLAAVLGKDYAWLHSHAFPGVLTEADTSAAYALLASQPDIEISKFTSVYSPSRLSFMLENQALEQYYCKFAWNVDLDRRWLNCCSYFQAWGITRDLPWAPKMKDHHQKTSKLFNMYPLSVEDRELAMSCLEEAFYLDTRLALSSGGELVAITLKRDVEHMPALAVPWLVGRLQSLLSEPSVRMLVLTELGVSAGAKVVPNVPPGWLQGKESAKYPVVDAADLIKELPMPIVGVLSRGTAGWTLTEKLQRLADEGERRGIVSQVLASKQLMPVALALAEQIGEPIFGLSRGKAGWTLTEKLLRLADEGKQWGAVSQLLPSDQLMPAALSSANQICGKARPMHRLCQDVIRSRL